MTVEPGAKSGFVEEALPHVDAVYRFAIRLAGSADEAEDLVQETFLRAFRAWDQYTRGTNAKSWLFTICRNVFLRARERAQRHQEILAENATRVDAVSAPVASPMWSTGHGVDPEGEFFDSIVDERIIAAIEELPEEYRTAVVLSDIEGLPYAEIAALMEVPVGTVKSRLFRGRRRLQQVLYEYAVEMGYISAAAGENVTG
jgi:RNA polymerase sigma-70 factor, ECF subfamily